jgi:hypothetical protein
VRINAHRCPQGSRAPRVTLPEFGKQVLALVAQLAARHGQFPLPGDTRDLAGIEGVATARCFRLHGAQVRRECAERVGALQETDQLRMVPIAARASAQHGLRQQRLTPQGDQSFRVQVTGV